jgi:hypothetical protein
MIEPMEHTDDVFELAGIEDEALEAAAADTAMKGPITVYDGGLRTYKCCTS